MPNPQVPHFPRGFLLADRPIEPPPSFVPGPILSNFYIHPWTKVDAAGDQESFVIVLGHCVATHPDQSGEPARELLDDLLSSEEVFLRSLDDYSGRYAIIFGTLEDLRIVNDATAMRSVFYAEEGGVAASHALLVEEALGGYVSKDDLVFGYGFPGNRTPYTRTKILTPNTFYSFTSNSLHRFWPRTVPNERSADSVAVEALSIATNALKRMGEMGPVKIALTAGLDSRVTLAVALNSGLQFETYTYGVNKQTALDRAFAPDLAARFGIRHSLIPQSKSPPGLQLALKQANYSPSHVGAVPGLMEYFENPHTAVVTANLLEIGQSFYKQHRKRGAQEPVDYETMAALHFQSLPVSAQGRVEEFGFAKYFETAHEAFETFICDTGYDTSIGLLDPFDQFYWEHRMGTWHGPLLLERDFYGVPFIPFNSRRLFQAMLGISKANRDEATMFYQLIELVEPRLLELPINPKTWP